MKPEPRVSVPLWTLLLLSSLLEISRAECVNTCNSTDTETLTITTTTVTFGPNCTLSMEDDTSRRDSTITGLTPGTVNSIFFNCLNCCKEVTTKPEVVRNLSVTDTTTSSVSLTWAEPEGKSSFYIVQWTNGSVNGAENQSETSTTITGLTSGVQYNISVTAVADDDQTKGEKVTVQAYTRPEAVRNLSVSQISTSSVSLTWTEPEGNSSFYRVQWTDGNFTETVNVTETYVHITNLTAGVQHEISVTAVAGDGFTEGQSTAFTQYTRPEAVRNLSVSQISTSSVSLTWTEPEGNSSFYRVQWTDGNFTETVNVTETYVHITNLTAGVQYEISVTAVAGDGFTEGQSTAFTQYTKPEVVRNLSVAQISTWSVCLTWTEPEGNSSFYRVQWTDGTTERSVSVTETKANVTELIAGVQYNFTVIAVAGNNKTEGEMAEIVLYTRPEAVRNLSVSQISTSSVSLTWTEPEGNSSFYRVQWTDGNFTETVNVTETYVHITNLTAGVQYEISVTAVAGDGFTEGQSTAFTQYTKPGKITQLLVDRNTTSISLTWTPPPGEVFMYRVEWQVDRSAITTNDTFAVLSELIPGTSYTITITAVAGDQYGEPYTISSVTRPAAVRSLAVTAVTTSSVTLNWTQPEGNVSWYTVQWTASGHNFSKTTNQTFFAITDLKPGFQYKITVAAVAVDSLNEGEGTAITTFTMPEKPENITIMARGTDNLNISWALPEGRADNYMVNISNEELMYSRSNITTATTAYFTGLRPGRTFVITVTAVAGNFTDTSDQSLFATLPTPPGSITIGHRTNASLHLSWATPALMEGAPHISYLVTYQPEDGEVLNETTTTNSTELSLLSSGTSYNIALKTVGAQNLLSSAVHNSAFTLPNPVLNLSASPKSTTSVEVTWSYPQGAKPYYKYLVQTYVTMGALFNTTTSSNSTDVPNLEPGTRYSINVKTRAATGSESTEEQTFSYTMPEAVTNLTVVDVNTTAVRLTWLRQSDHKPSYSYSVIALQDAVVVQSTSTENESYTFSGLIPGKLYTFNVSTVVAGVESTVKSTSSHTKPAAVSIVTVIGSTTNLSVSWTPAAGQVDSYSVLLYRDSWWTGSQLNNSVVNTLFVDLTPGVLYCALVVTKSGPFETNSSSVCNATFPTPPGPITVESQTVKSINFTWAPPEGMEHVEYNFSVSSFMGSFLIEQKWFLLDGLDSGSLYNISVVTVGMWQYESTAVTAENYTRPCSVTMLRQTEITTDAVTLMWEQPDNKSHYSYVVEASNGSFSQSNKVFNTSDTIAGLLSGSNYSFTVTTQTGGGTQAAPVTVSYFTRPFSVRQLEAETLNTTAVRLVWMEPLEFKNEYTYLVKTTGCGFQNTTLTGDAVLISELTPGTNCTFCVSARAADGIEGEAKCTSQYTKPETVQPSISSQGSNSSILVSWTTPPGRVEYYMVHLNGTSTSLEVQADNTSWLFENLSAGMLYTAMVTSYSGPFNASSGLVTNATFPNPPRPIEILAKTTSSIDIRWEEAPLMAGASFQYWLTYTPAQGGEYIPATNTSYTIASLLSGTSYNISVTTVGAMDFESEAVQIHMVTTRPFSVKNLNASTEEESITVMWVKPNEYKDSYRYNVTWQSSDGWLYSNTTDGTKYDIDGLVPGSLYILSVTTETSDGTQGASEWISNCTNASPVKNLQCEGPNKANAEIVLSWTSPTGQHSGFQVTVNHGEIDNISSTCCNHTVSNLRHYTEYLLTVKTLSCGEPSTPVSQDCWTGITNPPIPEDYEQLVVVSSKVSNKFSLQINSTLLNSSNGPITHVGVLVTSNLPGDPSNWGDFLGKTYNQWKEGDTPVYLATVKENIFQSRSGESHLNIEVGDESEWEGYTNGALDHNGKYQYALALFTSLSLQKALVSDQMSLVSITAFYPAVQLPADAVVSIGIAVGATLGIFCVLFIVLIGFIVWWKRIANKEQSDIQIQSIRAKVSVAVRVEDYEAYYRKQKADSNCGFAEEFEDLKLVGTAQSKTSALTMENKPKNRYNNVLPYDSSRVKLSIIHGSPYDDYINANYMPGYNSRKEFIAAQGPLPATVSEFWRMIWEKNVQTLVMLTRCNEQGRIKCEQYWDTGTKYFDNITVTTTSDIPLDDWTIREFDIKNVKTAETRSVRHFHFTAWPDHGVPETTELLISFRHLVREHMDQYSRHSPTVVHCSAGVGRTGTFIAIDRLIFQIERENIVDVYGIVHDLRMHRPLMVQTEDQYVFLNQCAMDIIRSRTGTNVDLIYQNTAALSIYENVEPKKGFHKNGYRNA
ncbi:receptor-type tyrosine-protein phosphatase eta isoform X3 [Chelmon rostratus]|uniref:receptor-type tyrosine-protein phosphatase eta isoform X3 n=1 Tax=Chelmon rostratus TaxID=109905 RepID=UPI001BE58346|nr:receptor-type tyrosine-protein phosphatase eta isoform X3 [Chelmon rostratus]